MTNAHEQRVALLDTPAGNRAMFDAALAACGATDLPRLILWFDSGVVRGDWRRAAIWGRIKRLRMEAGQ